jgi:hypothetical protein
MYQVALNRSRTDKFIIVLDVPKAIREKNDNFFSEENKIDSFQFSVFGSPVPDIKIPAMEIPYGGQVYKASSISRPAYNDLNIKFLIDNGYKNYWLLWKWLNLFNDFKKGGTELTEVMNVPIINDEKLILKNPMSDFTSKFSIFGMDEYNNKIISFNYTDAFPISLSEINYNNQDPSEITCNVSFAFNQLHVKLLKDINITDC